MDTKVIVESLLFKFKNRPYVKSSLRLARVINDSDRLWIAKNREEVSVYSNKFTNPIFVITIGFVITAFIVEKESKNRLYSVLTIDGPNCSFQNCSKGKLSLMINAALNFKDYLPNPYLRQIIYVPADAELKNEDSDEGLLGNIKGSNEDCLNCHIFSEYKKGVWTTDNNLYNLGKKSELKTTSLNIIKNILKEF